MANTYSQMYVQTIFVVKYRKAILLKDWRTEMFGVIGNLINDTGCKTVIVNGVEDHVHCFFGFNPKDRVSDVMRTVKANSSKWLNESGYLRHRFEWQPGYGSFTYSKSSVNKVCRYISNQEEKHKKMSFKEEYIRFLEKFEVEYDERYIFHDLI